MINFNYFLCVFKVQIPSFHCSQGDRVHNILLTISYIILYKYLYDFVLFAISRIQRDASRISKLRLGGPHGTHTSQNMG